jgi:hypothetical protein
MRIKTFLALTLAAASLAGAALTQDFPTLSFAQMIALDRQLIREQKQPERPGDLFFNPGANGGGKTRAVYTGDSRPLDQREQAFLAAFASTSVGNDQYASLFRREYRFTAGGKDWWLPAQSQVAAYFAKELKPGEAVTLYVRNAGGFRLSTEWEWIFLVEEYDAPTGKDAPPKEGKPGAKKKFEVPPGPKIAT